jgi:transcriptional regulator with XRE-family HTH domain
MAGEFGIVLRKLRRDRGATLREMGKDTGISHVHIAQWESGLFLPRPEKVHILAKYFRIRPITLAEIIRWEKQAKRNGGYSESAELFLTAYLMNMR